MTKGAYERKRAFLPALPSVAEPDWSMMILKIRGAGVTKVALAELLDTTRETLEAIEDGRSLPKWRQGELLRTAFGSLGQLKGGV